MIQLAISLKDRYFDVQFMGRRFIMDEFELLWFLPLAIQGIGPSRAQVVMDKVRASGVFLQEVGIKFDTIPGVYMRTQL
jgi:hypothetical protein